MMPTLQDLFECDRHLADLNSAVVVMHAVFSIAAGEAEAIPGGVADGLAREHLSIHPAEVWAEQCRSLERSEMPISLIAAWAAAVRSRLRADMARIASLN
jgi:hypothetical protein